MGWRVARPQNTEEETSVNGSQPKQKPYAEMNRVEREELAKRQKDKAFAQALATLATDFDPPSYVLNMMRSEDRAEYYKQKRLRDEAKRQRE